jgi:hypothetical protein
MHAPWPGMPASQPELGEKMMGNRVTMKVKIAVGCVVVGIGTYAALVAAADQSGFPDGYDAATAAPNSHHVIFENAVVRVLEVTIPPAGTSEPMHYHKWPGFFLDWDTGGKTNHLRYRRYDGSTRDIPSIDAPSHPGHWTVRWIEPEPMHAIETVEQFNDGKDLRVEIKIAH